MSDTSTAPGLPDWNTPDNRAKLSALVGWMEASFGRRARLDKHVYVDEERFNDDGSRYISFIFWTSVNEYTVSLLLGNPEHAELWATAVARMARPGALGRRSTSLSGGDCTPETWAAILGDILGCEMQGLDRSVYGLTAPEDGDWAAPLHKGLRPGCF